MVSFSAFRAAVHDNKDVPAVNKFKHLQRALKGKAAEAIGTWDITAENYEHAWTRLMELFNKKYPRVQAYIGQILNLPSLHNTTTDGLRTLAHTTYEVTRQLKTLGLPTEKWDMMLICILHSKLDPATSCEWELVRDNNDNPELSTMLKFLERRAAAYSNIPTAGSSNAPAWKSRAPANQGTSSTTQPRTTQTASKEGQAKKMHFCNSCQQEHQVYECPKFLAMSLSARKNFVQQRGLCPNCLRQGGHALSECRYKGCFKCPGAPQHNLLLCPARELAKNPVAVATTSIARKRQNADDQTRQSKKRRVEKNRQLKEDPRSKKENRREWKQERRADSKSNNNTKKDNNKKGESDSDEQYDLRMISKLSPPLTAPLTAQLKSKFKPPSNIDEIKNHGELNSERRQLTSLLPMAKVRLDVDGVVLGHLYALLDTGAQPNIITAQAVRQLQIPSTTFKREMIGIDGNPVQSRARTVIRLRPWFNSEDFIDAEFMILPSENYWNLVTIPILIELPNDGSLPRLANPEYRQSTSVQMILGVSTVASCLISVVPREYSNVSMLETIFGTVIYGSCPSKEMTATTLTINEPTETEQLNKAISRLWQIDQVPDAPRQSAQERLVEQIFVDNYKRDANGRFCVAIPLKEQINTIGDSRKIALHRFFALERKLNADRELRQKYIDFMREYESLGHMKLVDTTANIDEIIYYLPHHCVQKRFRVVFDGGCKTDRGISLNDIQLVGERLQLDLADIITRFRRHPIAVTADIRMMFRQIKVLPEFWNLQRIIWREGRNDPLKEYWLTVVTYGLASSPHNAVRALVQCGKDVEQEYPTVAKAIMKDFYMDDFLSGANSEGEARYLANKIDEILLASGFELRKWQSNHAGLRTTLQTAHNEQVAIGDDDNTTILGLRWNPKEDTFSYKIKPTADSFNLTKRAILSTIAQLYDPLGYIAPVTIVGRMIMQEIWKAKIDWDKTIPIDIEKMWLAFWKDIKELERFKIPRWIGAKLNSEIHLHGFADASSKAYGATIYVQIRLKNDNYTSRLLLSKSRVTPLKTVTIPRLELTAMELLARLMKRTLECLEWTGTPCTLWTDSMIALHWIHKEPYQCETFVANRVASIRSNSDISEWRHVSTSDNPADLLTRGMTATDLVNNKLWLSGPSWLTQAAKYWPKGSFDVKTQPREVLTELKTHTIYESTTKSLTYFSPALQKEMPLIEHTNQLDKLINVTAYIFRFINLLKDATANKERPKRRSKRKRTTRISQDRSGELSTEERTHALRYHLKTAQYESYKPEIAYLSGQKKNWPRSKIEPLKPILDKHGILRVGGRISHAVGLYEYKHPAIIPPNSRFGWLVVSDAHRKTRCGGVQVMTQYIRAHYWITRIRDEARRVVHRCVKCARFSKKICEQMMADLPAERVQPGKAFVHSGVDYAGPIEIRQLDKKNEEIIKTKCWIAIFVCLKTRAVHIDVVNELSSVAFIACYERFIARRGRCEKMFSDNGTAFTGANGMIETTYKYWNSRETARHLNLRRTEWHFSSPAAPHQGGIYEAAVKSMKFHLVRVVGAKSLTKEQLLTVLAQIEAILNSRPLHPLTDDPADYQALTPGHFLVGEPLVLPPPFEIPKQTNTTGVKLWRERQTIIKHIWERWENEYLTSLQERKKWRREKENIKIGQLVLLKSENHPPAHWALGRIIQVYPGKDGLIRNVKVKTASGEFLRAIQKICIVPLEPATER